MHRYLQASTHYFNSSHVLSSPENFPENQTTAGLASGLAAAHKSYGVPECVSCRSLLRFYI